MFAKVPNVGLKLTGLTILFVLSQCSMGRTTLISIIEVLIVKFVFKGLFDVLCDLTNTTLDLAIVRLLGGRSNFDLVNVDITNNIARGVKRLVITVVIIDGADLVICTPTLLMTNILTKVLVNKLAGRIIKQLPLGLWLYNLLLKL